MRVIYPITVTNAILDSSNVTEDDHPEWDQSSTYAAEDRVIVIGTTHKIYESAQGSNIDHDPTTDDGTWWTEISATNRWKAFDEYLADQVENSGSITYSLITDSVVTGAAFFMLGATSVRVQVYDTEDPANEVYDTTVDLVDGTEVTDWFTFFTAPLAYDTEALLIDFAAYSGYQIDITIDSGAGTARVGQIVLGRLVRLGETVEGTTPGYESFSVKERDVFGRVGLVDRDHSDTVRFRFSAPTQNQRFIKRTVTELDAVPAVWLADSDMTAFGLTIYGFPTDYDAPLSAGGRTEYTIEIEGLT